MIEATVLRRAVERGLITGDQALGLERLALEDTAAPAAFGVAGEERDDERLRFITGFADIFVTIGLVLFLGTSWYLVYTGLGQTGGVVLVALLSWGLAEFFTRRRRMALPSIVLLAAFAVGTFIALQSGLMAGSKTSFPSLWSASLSAADAWKVLIAGLLTLAVVALHYWRFAVPITVAAGAAIVATVAIALVHAVAPAFAEGSSNGVLLVLGVAIFALAMRFDLSDPQRLTRRTDIAFWLHLLSAPLIVHPVLRLLVGADSGSAASAVTVLGIVLTLALVALVTDRRAILVSGLTYAGVAVGSLIRQAGFTGNTGPLSLLALGAFILLLSAGWHPLRKQVLRALPRHLAARLPHPIGA